MKFWLELDWGIVLRILDFKSTQKMYISDLNYCTCVNLLLETKAIRKCLVTA